MGKAGTVTLGTAFFFVVLYLILWRSIYSHTLKTLASPVTAYKGEQAKQLIIH